MLDFLIGVSRDDFLRKNAIPANDNDALQSDRCPFCWGFYDEHHPATHILPCNHVFGEPCIEEMTAAPGGDLCPVCRVELFRPPLKVVFQDMVAHCLTIFHSVILASFERFKQFWSRQSSGVRLAAYMLSGILDSALRLYYARYECRFLSSLDEAHCPQVLSIKERHFMLYYRIGFSVVPLGAATVAYLASAKKARTLRPSWPRFWAEWNFTEIIHLDATGHASCVLFLIIIRHLYPTAAPQVDLTNVGYFMRIFIHAVFITLFVFLRGSVYAVWSIPA